jgi:hypothetical protein
MTEGEVFNDSKDIFLGSRVAFYKEGDVLNIFRGFIHELPDNADGGGDPFIVKFDREEGRYYEFNKREILGKWITYECLQCARAVDLIISLQMPWY